MKIGWEPILVLTNFDEAVLVDDDGVGGERRLDNDEEAYAEVHAAMKAGNIVREGLVGRAEAHLLRADDLDRVLESRLHAEGTTIYRLSEVQKERAR